MPLNEETKIPFAAPYFIQAHDIYNTTFYVFFFSLETVALRDTEKL